MWLLSSLSPSYRSWLWLSGLSAINIIYLSLSPVPFSLQIQHCPLQQQTTRNGQFGHPQRDPDHPERRLSREALPDPEKLARWVVLTNNLVLTYKERRVYESPTEIVLLKDVISIKTAEDELQQKNSFKIQTNTTTFYFCADTGAEKESWIGALGRALVKRNNKDLD